MTEAFAVEVATAQSGSRRRSVERASEIAGYVALGRLWRLSSTSVPNGELFPSTDTGRARCYERTDHLDLRLGS
jgi:hypothetical protein